MEQLKMIWKPTPLIEYPPRNGYEIVAYDGTEEMTDGWIEVSRALTGSLWSREEFKKNMLGLHNLKPDGIFLAREIESGKIAATASACIDEEKAKYGTLHMVCTHPSYKGLGLGKAVCRAAVAHFLEHGVPEADLLTDDFRIPAVAIYISFGFLPYLYLEDMEERWRSMLPALGLKGIQAYNDQKVLIDIGE